MFNLPMRICFHCDKEIKDALDYKMYPLDIPYLNLFFHKSCFIGIGGYDKMPIYVTQYRERVYNWYVIRNNEGKLGKNSKK